jgi:hypothetical protein
MFKLNKNIKIKKNIINGSIVYIIDNFYKNPDKILNLFLNSKLFPHKINENPSFNSIYFEDYGNDFQSEELSKPYKFLSKLCNQRPLYGYNQILTNVTRFKKNQFNDYKNNYWWPHIDAGYTGIVYFNKGDHDSGTNIYQNLNPNEEPPNCPEHYAPWRCKNNFKLIKSIKPKYNRMFLFDGLSNIHGMNICNDDYFEKKYRINQVFFFKKEDKSNSN